VNVQKISAVTLLVASMPASVRFYRDVWRNSYSLGTRYKVYKLGDAAAVSAMVDRLLHHGHVLKCGPRSWRTKTDLPPQEAAG
jgi:hypothetical protein